MPRRRTTLLVLAAAALPAAAAAPAPAADPPFVPQGVSAGGVDLSGLTLQQAEAKLEQVLGPRYARDMVVGVAGRVFKLTPAGAKFDFDALTTAKRALRNGGPGDVALKISHSSAAVQAFAAKVDKGVAKPGRNATAKITLRRIRLTNSRPGHDVDVAALAKAVNAQFAEPNAPRYVRTKVRKRNAAVTQQDLRRKYATVLTVDKRNFKLRLFKGLKVVKTYGVATGQPAYPTPSGTFSIVNKQVNPTWSVPNSPWAGELAGTTVQGGSASNPLKARWMGIVNGVGIHGTGQEYSIGSRASHGCIRMRVADVIALYKRVPVGTTILIK